MRRILLAAAIMLAAVAPPGAAQTVQDILGRYVGANANGYLGPLADVIGATLNSGWARSARVEPGFHLKLAVVGSVAPISDSRRTFTATTGEGFVPASTATAPTIFGSTETVAVAGQGGTSYRFPGGIDAATLGLAIPQLSLGSVAGTEASVRWFGMDLSKDLGKISLFGIGVRHDLGRYMKHLPVDLAVGAYWQSFKAGDVVSISAFTVMAHASRKAGMATLYGGVGFERSTSEITYTQDGETTGVDISLKGANSVRGTVGLALRLLIMDVFADYTLASQNALTLGFAIGR